MQKLEVTQIIKLESGGYGAVIQRDYAKETVTLKLFDYMGDAYMWVHDGSLAQFPEWHKENCPVCKAKNG